MSFTGKLVTFNAGEGVGFILPFHVSGLLGLTYCHISQLTSECPEEMIEGSTLVFDIDVKTKNAIGISVINFGGFKGMGRAEAARRIRARDAPDTITKYEALYPEPEPELAVPANPLMIVDEDL